MTTADNRVRHGTHGTLIGADQLAKRPVITRQQAGE
jgi:hypothetical protein